MDKNKYQKAWDYVNTVRNGAYPSATSLYEKIQRLDFKSVETFETAILRAKAFSFRSANLSEFNKKFCDACDISSQVGYLEQKSYSRHDDSEFKKKALLFKDIIIREGFEFFNPEMSDYIKTEIFNRIGN